MMQCQIASLHHKNLKELIAPIGPGIGKLVLVIDMKDYPIIDDATFVTDDLIHVRQMGFILVGDYLFEYSDIK